MPSKEQQGISISSLVGELLSFGKQTASMAIKITDTLIYSSGELQSLSGKQRAILKETGELIRDMRKVAGLSYQELSEALDLTDNSLLEAIETGTATLSFEVILKLSSLLARHDPIPFTLELIHAYQPELWSMLERWGIGHWPSHYKRERSFLNIYRQNDAARKLTDEQFEKAAQLTQAAFDMAVDWLRD